MHAERFYGKDAKAQGFQTDNLSLRLGDSAVKKSVQFTYVE